MLYNTVICEVLSLCMTQNYNIIFLSYYVAINYTGLMIRYTIFSKALTVTVFSSNVFTTAAQEMKHQNHVDHACTQKL